MQRERRTSRRNRNQSHKLGIIVPYRDREQQLKRFLTHMKDYLKDIEYEIFIIEQSEGKSFNRGKLLNVGYKHAVEKGCDYFVFHDVDMLPEDVDYSYSEKPLHLATHLQEHDYETTFFDYFGGVTMFTKDDFKTINGFSNEYWGWGFEDDDLLVRCIESDLDLDTESFGSDEIQTNESFKFNGDDSFIKLETENSILLQDDFSISVLVKPEKIKVSENKEYDEYPILSIPGYNIGLFYNSFRRFFCQVYDNNKKPYSISTDILGERWVNLTIVYSDGNTIKLFLNGELVDEIVMDTEILQLNSDIIYVGTTNDKKFNTDFFYGLISDIEIYDIALEDYEIKEISNNPKKPKIRDFGEFKSSGFLYSHILPELSNGKSCVDIAGNFKVNLNNIYLYKDNQSFRTFLPKPYRRTSRFKSLKHKSNSSVGNKWIHKETRKNQIKYYNEVRQDIVDFRIDGLNTLRYELIEKKVNDGVNIIKVNI
jgi:predicted peroxiredoxin